MARSTDRLNLGEQRSQMAFHLLQQPGNRIIAYQPGFSTALVEVSRALSWDSKTDHSRGRRIWKDAKQVSRVKRIPLESLLAPDVIEIVDELPKTVTGKIQKFVLRDREWAGREARIYGGSTGRS